MFQVEIEKRKGRPFREGRGGFAGGGEAADAKLERALLHLAAKVGCGRATCVAPAGPAFR